MLWGSGPGRTDLTGGAPAVALFTRSADLPCRSGSAAGAGDGPPGARRPTLVPVTRALALALVALLAGCGGAPRATSASSPAPAGGASPTPCPAGSAAPVRWPQAVPADLPVPPTTRLASTERTPEGLVLVRFSTSQSVRDGVVFLVGALQPAGFTIGRGDAEGTEADVPFTRGSTRGLLKMLAQGPCRTSWVLAVQDGAAAAGSATPAPLLPHVGRSPSPLPFG